jgi:hypothetical protein
MPHLVGQGPIAQVGPTSVGIPHTSPPPMALGQEARDADGNVYILCQAGEAVFSEQPVTISANFTVAALAATGRGPVGICQAGVTSDELVWVQVKGYCFAQLGMGGVSPSDAANGPTTLSTSVMTRFVLATTLTTPPGLGWVSDASSLAVNFYIDDIFVATDADLTAVSATTLATSHTGNRLKVWLNYPSIRYINYGA